MMLLAQEGSGQAARMTPRVLAITRLECITGGSLDDAPRPGRQRSSSSDDARGCLVAIAATLLCRRPMQVELLQ